jgi:hypothetical protein
MSKIYVSVLVLGLFLLITPFNTAAKPVSAADVLEDSWASKAPINQARGGLGVAVVNGKIYAIGGSTASGPYPPDAFAGGFVGTNEEYDPATDTWTYKASMPTPRDHFAIVAFQNKIYCIGGAIGFSVDERSGFYSYVSSGVNEVYDTLTNTWETKTPLPDDGMKIQAHVVNGKIYVMDWSLTYVYDPENDSWSLKTRMPPPYPASSPVSVVVDNKIIVTGEFAVGWNYTSEQKVLIYDTETDSWSGGRSGPIVIGGGAAGATVGAKTPQKIYVLGLKSGSPRPLSVNQVYDPKADTWASATAMPTNRTDFSIAVVNDALYAIGGYPSSSYVVTPTNANEQYIPIGYGTIQPIVAIISPKNQSYNSSSVSLIFTVDMPASWIGYSLDGKDNVTVTGNTTLAGLSNGLHNITVYAKDSFGNIGASEPIDFTVACAPFPTGPVVAASGVTVAVVAVGLFYYFKKRNH